MTRVLVCGGRHYNDWQRFNALLDGIHRQNGISQIIQGDASGADWLGRMWAENNNVPLSHFPADWKDTSQPDAKVRFNDRGEAYDAMAGFRRNQEMIDFGGPDLVIAFPGGKGTLDMCQRAVAAGVATLRVNPPRDEYFDAVVDFENGPDEEPPWSPTEWLLPPDPKKPKKPRRAEATPADRYDALF